jgi:hypothetical protein
VGKLHTVASCSFSSSTGHVLSAAECASCSQSHDVVVVVVAKLATPQCIHAADVVGRAECCSLLAYLRTGLALALRSARTFRLSPPVDWASGRLS